MHRFLPLFTVCGLLPGCAPEFNFTGRTLSGDQTIAVGETITFGVTYENGRGYVVALLWSVEPGAEYVELLGLRSTNATPNSAGSDSREFRALAPGAAGLRVRADGNREEEVFLRVEPAVSAGNHTLTVAVRAAGTVTSEPAGINCKNESYTATKECAAALAPGRYKLTASPDTAHGFSRAVFTGCDATNLQCELDLTAHKAVEVLFDR